MGVLGISWGSLALALDVRFYIDTHGIIGNIRTRDYFCNQIKGFVLVISRWERRTAPFQFLFKKTQNGIYRIMFKKQKHVRTDARSVPQSSLTKSWVSIAFSFVIRTENPAEPNSSCSVPQETPLLPSQISIRFPRVPPRRPTQYPQRTRVGLVGLFHLRLVLPVRVR